MFKRSRFIFLALILSLTVSLMSPYRVAAAAIEVTHTFDGYDQNQQNFCTLRMAVVAANENRKVGRCAAGSATEIDFISLPPGSYQLERKGDDLVCSEQDKAANNCYYGDLDITESLVISGSGNVIIHATLLDNRVFHINTSGSVLLRNMTIKFGAAPTIETGNSKPGRGGGIYNQRGVLAIENSIIDSNNGPNGGGGIANETGATTTIHGSVIKNNTSRVGGGILNNGIVDVRNSLIFNNFGSERGGGLNNNVNTGSSVLTNVTLSTNGSPEGSGLFSQSNIEIINSTITANTSGAALYITGTGKIINSIVVGHDATNCVISGNGFQSFGYNLLDQADCSFAIGTDQIVVQPDVTQLIGTMDHQTKGETMYVLPVGSPAINAGTNTGCSSHDQRGIFYIRPRTNVDVCDVGSYEVTAVYTVNMVYLPITRR